MNIFYDENMPFAKEFFSGFGQLTAFNGRAVTAEQLVDADVLLVRSVTKVTPELLKQNTRLKFVGTATIGVDHIDQSYLKERDIAFYSAPGCNAISVAEYVISCLVVLAERYQLDLFSLTVGIIGAGNTGTRLSEKLNALGIKYVLCDPPLAESKKDARQFVELEQALSCDVISLHVPKVLTGQHPTYHLLDQQCLNKLTEQQILINACRGEVIDNQALLKLKQNGHGLKLVLDVWENEPNILQPLIEHTEISTAHIAGYSLEGKAKGTEILYRALSDELGLDINKDLSQMLPKSGLSQVEIDSSFSGIILNQLVKMVYDVRRDDSIFRQSMKDEQNLDQRFDNIRKTYPTRREFSAVTVKLVSQTKCDEPHLLGFSK